MLKHSHAAQELNQFHDVVTYPVITTQDLTLDGGRDCLTGQWFQYGLGIGLALGFGLGKSVCLCLGIEDTSFPPTIF